MTRINVTPVSTLCDEHLVCELREILRIPKMVASRKSLADVNVLPEGSVYRLGQGHVRFFYDKLGYIKKRYHELLEETRARGKHATDEWNYAWDFDPSLCNDYSPTPEAKALNQERLDDRMTNKFKPTFTERKDHV